MDRTANTATTQVRLRFMDMSYPLVLTNAGKRDAPGSCSLCQMVFSRGDKKMPARGGQFRGELRLGASRQERISSP